jgi:ferric-dicitrate binding protein FerR (iron transport regulator)
MSDIELIISKYLADADECTAQEKLDLENFLNASEDNRRYFEELKAMWEAGSGIPDFYPDANLGWNKLQEKITGQRKVEKKHPHRWLKIAASIVFFIGLSVLFSYLYHFRDVSTKLAGVIRTGDLIKKVLLPDSSVVWLNKKSIVAWDDHFGKEERKVYLVGEAYFEITHNKQKPFIVYANYGTKTKVLGTSFSLKSRVQDTTVFLQVITGVVEFASVRKQTSEKLIVKKGEAAFTNHNEVTIFKAPPEKNILAWKDGKLSFSNTPLEEVCHTLEEYFSTRIELRSPAIRSCHFTGNFQSPTLTDVLEILKKAMPIDVDIKDNLISLSGKGCMPNSVP